MKRFYLVRREDMHGVSGTGVVAEGVVFDSGMVAMTWLSELESATFFRNVRTLIKIHGHEGRTIVVMEERDAEEFAACRKEVRAWKSETRKGKRDAKQVS